MKQASEVKQEISKIHLEIIELDSLNDKKSISAASRLRSKLPQLKEYVLYLETNPTEDYCKKEVLRLENRVLEIMKLYKPLDAERFTKGQITANLKSFEKLWQLSKVKSQIKALNYLLN